MEETEARDLLLRLSAKAGKAFSEKALDPILALSGPHPLFLQVAGYRAFEEASDGGSLPAEALPQIRRRMLADLEPHLQYYWNELDEEERYTLAALPMTGAESLSLAEAGLVRNGKYIGSILEAFVRRQKVPGLLQGGPFLIDLRRSQATVDGQPVHLTPTEFSLLKVFLEKPGRMLTPQEIESALWPDENILDPERARGSGKEAPQRARGIRRLAGQPPRPGVSARAGLTFTHHLCFCLVKTSTECRHPFISVRVLFVMPACT